jgi:hypothetical protein
MSNNPPPSPTGFNGRADDGRFAAGNVFGKGNPFSRRTQRIRAELFRSLEPGAILAAARKIVAKAKAGDLKSFAEILDRTLGRPNDADLRNRLDALIWELNHGGDKAKLRRFAVEMKDTITSKPPAEPARNDNA